MAGALGSPTGGAGGDWDFCIMAVVIPTAAAIDTTPPTIQTEAFGFIENSKNNGFYYLLHNLEYPFPEWSVKPTPIIGVYFKAGSVIGKQLQSTTASAIPGGEFFPLTKL